MSTFNHVQMRWYAAVSACLPGGVTKENVNSFNLINIFNGILYKKIVVIV